MYTFDCYNTECSHRQGVNVLGLVHCLCVWVGEYRSGSVLTLRARVGIRGEFDVVAGKQTLPPVELSFPPIAVVLVEHCDHLTLLEGKLVIVLSHVVIHADHLTHSCTNRPRTDMMDRI